MPEEAKLADELQPIWKAFCRLSADRPQRMAIIGGETVKHYPEPISFLSIDAYARRCGFDDPATFAEFRRWIEAMDDEYLKALAAQAEGGG